MNGLHSLSDYHKNEYFCNVLIPSEDTKILEFNQKSDKTPFFTHAGLEYLIEKIETC